MENEKKASELTDDNPSEQFLIAEYQACQTHNGSINSQQWVSITLMITVNLVILGQVITNLVLTGNPYEGHEKLILVLLISILMIYILLLFQKWNVRNDFVAKLNWERAREIEKTKHMLKNWRIHGLDNMKEGKSNDEVDNIPWLKNHLETINDKYKTGKCSLIAGENKYIRRTTKGTLKFNCILWVLMGVWVIVIALEAFSYCPVVYRWLLN